VECPHIIKSEPDKAVDWLKSLSDHDFELVKGFTAWLEDQRKAKIKTNSSHK